MWFIGLPDELVETPGPHSGDTVPREIQQDVAPYHCLNGMTVAEFEKLYLAAITELRPDDWTDAQWDEWLEKMKKRRYRQEMFWTPIILNHELEGLGAQTTASNLSLLTTAKRQGKNPVDLFQNILLHGTDTPLSAIYETCNLPP